MSTQTTTPPRREQVRAVLLAMIMVTSVFAMSVSFVGTTTAASGEPAPTTELNETLSTEIDTVSNIEYDSNGGIMFITGADSGANNKLWAVDPSTQAIQWSEEIAELDGNEEIEFNQNYVFLLHSDEILAFDRGSGAHASFTTGLSTANKFNDIDAGSDYLYVAAQSTDVDHNGLYVLEPDTANTQFNIIQESISQESVAALAINENNNKLAIFSPFDSIDVFDIEKSPFNIDTNNPTVIHDLSEDYTDPDLSAVGLEYGSEDIYLFEHNSTSGSIGPGHMRALSVDTDATTISESWRTSLAGVGYDPTHANFGYDENWVYTLDKTNNDAVALDRADGTVGWTINNDVDADARVDAITPGADGDSIDLFAYVESAGAYLWGIADGLTTTDSTSQSGTITTTVDSPHPDVTGVELVSTNTNTDITQEGVGQPKGSYNLSIGLDGELADVDRVNVELYRINELQEKLANDPSQDEYYNLTIAFDADGNATVSSAHNSDTHLSTTAVSGIDRAATTDNVVVEITFPENVRPSANTQNTTVNGYSWEVGSTPVNEDIASQDDPVTSTYNFEIGTLIDATINTGSIEQKEDLILPGFNNVSHGPTGADDAISIVAGGNVKTEIMMSSTDLEHETTNDVIQASNTKVLAGSGHTLDDHNHADVTPLSNNPATVGASTLTNGQSEEFRMWVDYPENIEPGVYTGEFKFTITEVGAS